MWAHILYLSLTAAFGGTLTQKSCPTTFNLPAFLIEPRDQADLEWCYAYAGADLVSAYVGKEVSAADMAISYNATKINQSYFHTKRKEIDREAEREDFRPSGVTSSAVLIRLINGGYCLEQDFPSSLFRQVRDNSRLKMSEVRKVPLSDRLYDALRMGRLNYTPKDCNIRPGAKAFPNLRIQEITSILNVLNDLDGDKNRSLRLAHLAHSNCQKRRVKAPFTSKQVVSSKLSIKGLNEVLNSGRLAEVGVPLVPTIEEPTIEIEEKYRNDRAGLEKSRGSHSMLLAGRRWDSVSNSCQFIFKNSWGSVEDKDKKTTQGYTIINESALSEVLDGWITTINKAPNWKPAATPDFLKN